MKGIDFRTIRAQTLISATLGIDGSSGGSGDGVGAPAVVRCCSGDGRGGDGGGSPRSAPARLEERREGGG